MGVTINVNNLTLCHKGSNGISTATIPDVCLTPTPTGPVPIPYPNIAMSSDLTDGTTTVEADGGNMCANYGSQFMKSTGDEPGVNGGVASGTFIKEATWITFSFDVKLEGKAACRLTDKMFHNHQNTVNAAGLLQYVLGGDKAMNLACNIFCKALKKWEEFKGENPEGRFNFSGECENIAKSEYGSEMAELGMRAEEKVLVNIGEKAAVEGAEATAVEGAEKGFFERVYDAGRKLFTNEEVVAKVTRLGADTAKAGAEIGAEALVGAEVGAEGGGIVTLPAGGEGAVPGGAIGGIIGGAVGVVNVVMDAYLINDLAEAGGAAIEGVINAWKGASTIVRPDLVVAGENGAVERILDFKAPWDRWRNAQKEIYERATGSKVEEVNLDSCNQCKEA